jgi:hypothetical protein
MCVVTLSYQSWRCTVLLLLLLLLLHSASHPAAERVPGVTQHSRQHRDVCSRHQRRPLGCAAASDSAAEAATR